MFRMLVHPSSGACDSTNKSQAPEDGCTKIRNMLSGKWSLIKQVTSSWSIFIQL